MKESIHRKVFWLCLIVSIFLIICSFFIPPTGIIDPSVLTAIGELFAFSALGLVPTIIRERNVKITKGDMEIDIIKDAEQNA